jgi:hypothetical protein
MQSVQKVLLRFFPTSLPFSPFVFTLQFLVTFWVQAMQVLDMLWVSGACNMLLSMLYALWNSHNMQGYECKTCSSITQFVLENINGAKGRLGKKITALLLYWPHSISLANLTFSFCRHSRAWNSQSCQHQPPWQIWSNFKHLSRARPLLSGYGNSERTSGPETLSPTLISTYGENDSLKT